MAEIQVTGSKAGPGWTFEVTVTEGGRSSRHQVTLSESDFRRLSGGKGTPEDLVRRSFEFLLRREAKESILPRFDLPIISRYFPDYERSI